MRPHDADDLGRAPPPEVVLVMLPPPRRACPLCGCLWLWRSVGASAWTCTRCDPPSWLEPKALVVMRAEGVPRPLAAVPPEARCGRIAAAGGSMKGPQPPSSSAKSRRRKAPSRSATILARAVARLGVDRVLELLRLRPADLVAVAEGRASLPAATLRKLEAADRD